MRFQQLSEATATDGQLGCYFLRHMVQCEFLQGQTQRFQDTRQDCTAPGSADCFAGTACVLIIGSVCRSGGVNELSAALPTSVKPEKEP